MAYQIPTITKYASELTPHPENYNAHPKSQIAQLVESLATFGQFKNLVTWTCPQNMTTQEGIELHEGVCYILAGHGLWLAAMEAGLDQLEVKDYSGLSYEMALSLLMVDNAAPLGSEPDAARLAQLLERTRAIVADKSGLAGMLEALRQKAGVNGKGQAPEEAPPPVDKAELLQEVWQVKPGDIWQADRHFIICGDCRDGDTWKRLLGAAGLDKVNGVFTSPPYAEQRKAQYGGVPTDKYVEWWEAVQSNVRANLAGDGSFFVNIKPHCEDGQRVLYVFDLVLAMVRVWGWRFVDELCWVNGGYPGHFSPRFKNGFEPVYHFAIGDVKHRPDNTRIEMTEANKRKTAWNKDEYGERGRYYSPTGSKMNLNQSTFDSEFALPNNVLNIPADRGFLRDDVIREIHAAVFPVALPTFFIKAYSDPGDSWLDLFCGSGTTMVAAHNEGRVGLGIEQLPKYCSVICERLKALGLTPTLVSG